MGQNINADWARKESNNILSVRVLKEISDCNDAIKFAVTKNEMSCYVNLYAHSRTIEDLRLRGFVVKQHDDQRDGSSLQINW
jgi:hypothetical protein